jgi:putative zinc finger/helix-turn-helix YgiT family protein
MTRSYPWKCRNCGNRAVEPAVVDYSAEVEHDGRPYSLEIPNLSILECQVCHSRILTDEAHEKVTEALRAKAGLLTPKEIREQRKLLRLNQEQFAKYLRVAKETVSRWETGGQIQQRAMDLLIRLFFGVPAVRLWLDNPSAFPSIVFPINIVFDASLSPITASGPGYRLVGGAPSENILPRNVPPDPTKVPEAIAERIKGHSPAR